MNAERLWFLSDLLDGFVSEGRSVPSISVSGMSLNSRTIVTDQLFVAIQGRQHHGLDFADEAIRRGACAILTDQPADIKGKVPLVVMPELEINLGLIADRFFDHPSRAMHIIAVTGTNGKTSVSHFLAQLLRQKDKTGVIGTLGYGVSEPARSLQPLSNTTPDVIQMHAILAELREQGCRWVVLEASSHGLDQGRLNGISIDQAIFTNLTRDHLDYHGDMDHYARAKEKLFDWPGLASIVTNVDDGFGRKIANRTFEGQVLGYSFLGFNRVLDRMELIAGRKLEFNEHGVAFEVSTAWGDVVIRAPIYGRYNAYNLLAVIAALIGFGFSLDEVSYWVSKISPVPGRMEALVDARNRMIVIDYAHTPDALEQTLTSLRSYCSGALWCVFGAGGDRDHGKRPLMGRVAEEKADRIVLTNDNPRTESPDEIIKEILSGIAAPGQVEVIPDRYQAISRVLEMAGDSDVVLIAGKGHEETQIDSTGQRPFSDRDVVRSCLKGVA